MFVKIDRSKPTPAMSNKGSVKLLAEYLEKENEDKPQSDKEQFFSHSYDKVSKGTVINQIDANIKDLGRNDSKFFMLTVNPSHREMQHLIEKATGKSQVTNFSMLTVPEQAQVKLGIRDYTRGVMDLYAKNFDRETVKDGNDLVYFAKIEENRKWRGDDKVIQHNNRYNRLEEQYMAETDTEKKGQLLARMQQHGFYAEDKNTGRPVLLSDKVLTNDNLQLIITGANKSGLNIHVHIVVSRNNKAQDTKLSPHAKSRGNTWQLNGQTVNRGFNHESFKQQTAELFNQKFGYKPFEKESYQPRNIKQERETPNNAASIVKHNAVALAKNQLWQGQFFEERKAIGRASTVINTVKKISKSPMLGATSLALATLKSAIMSAGKDKEPEMEK